MSLAIYAAPFNTNSTSDDNPSFNTEYSAIPSNNVVVNKRRNPNNRTQKRVSPQDFNGDKVNSVLDAIHKSQNTSADSNTNSLGDFKPLEPPISVGVENTKINNPNIESHAQDDDIDLHNLKTAYMDEKAASKYYSQFMPGYSTPQYVPQSVNNTAAQMNSNINPNMNSNDTLMNKLNYMIHLLEEKHDERTNNVTEEVVLYSFLGIFMIFIVDSFVRVGKYVR